MIRQLRNTMIAAMFAVAGLTAIPAQAITHTGGEYNTLYAGQGAKGYDVVAYFTDNKAVQGLDEFVAEYGGATWKFASAKHRDMFKANPAKYAPQYGGFCAWGVANDKLFDIDPVNGWTIVDGKLYLNFNADILSTFNKDVSGFTGKANRNWPKLNK